MGQFVDGTVDVFVGDPKSIFLEEDFSPALAHFNEEITFFGALNDLGLEVESLQIFGGLVQEYGTCQRLLNFLFENGHGC